FWMDALESKPAAIKLCQEMGWKLTGVFDHKSNTMLPIITEQEKPYTYTDGDKVEFNNDTLSGSGIVRGVALTVTSIHGVHYIIEIVECEKAFPNDDYPFHFITVLDEHLKAA
ncbi:MAG: hypothetical protein RSG77_23745, partial [Hafnia sp.]